LVAKPGKPMPSSSLLLKDRRSTIITIDILSAEGVGPKTTDDAGEPTFRLSETGAHRKLQRKLLFTEGHFQSEPVS
jgi:hypothetical protein